MFFNLIYFCLTVHYEKVFQQSYTLSGRLAPISPTPIRQVGHSLPYLTCCPLLYNNHQITFFPITVYDDYLSNHNATPPLNIYFPLRQNIVLK